MRHGGDYENFRYFSLICDAVLSGINFSVVEIKTKNLAVTIIVSFIVNGVTSRKTLILQIAFSACVTENI